MRYAPLTAWLPRRHPPTTGEVLRGVELFASGRYRGKDYTVADLEEMAANFEKLGPKGLRLLDPPAALGHEETQKYLERTDLPAAGWVRRVQLKKYHEPATGQEEAVLVGDIVGVPKPIANKIRSRQYRKVSAEVYSDFTDDFGNSYGKALRRVAFLGSEVPQVKRIGDLPMPTPAGPGDERFAERRPTRLKPAAAHETAGGTVWLFSEVVTMGDPNQAPTRQDRVDAILKIMPQLSMPTLDGMTDDQLADLAKNLPPVAPAAPAPPPAAPAPDLGAAMPGMTDPTLMQPMPGMGMPPQGVEPMGDLTRDEMIAELQAAGQDPAALQGMSDDDLKNLLAQTSGGGGGMAPMADGEGMSREEMIAELSALGEDPDALNGMTDEDLQAMYAELTTGDDPAPAAGDVAAMSEQTRRIARHNLLVVRRQHRQLKRQDAEAFCDRLVAEGRLFPAHRTVFLGNLLGKDNLRATEAFSERPGTKAVRLTPYEAEKRRLARLPVVVRFAERVAAGGQATGGPSGEVQKVEKFAELTGSQLRKHGTDPKALVETAKRKAAEDPEFRAEQLIGRSGVELVGG